MNPPLNGYPLTWPPGRKRAKYPVRSRFGDVTFGRARDSVIYELGRLRAKRVILSTNVRLKADGLPYANTTRPKDQGVAVYFSLKDRPMVFACDDWDRIEHNLWAIAKTIEALRGIERWGSGEMLERAFTGFTSLPAPEEKKHWREILGFMGQPLPTRVVLKDRRDELAHQHHPDRGGDGEMMREINRAFEEANREIV